MRKASARHILVADKTTCDELKTRIDGGEDFAEMARQYSECPSGQQGGDLGEFSADMGKVHGPVRTEFGYPLIEITKRSA
jgi:peptidyl-prolyl cis-trans isomerase C